MSLECQKSIRDFFILLFVTFSKIFQLLYSDFVNKQNKSGIWMRPIKIFHEASLLFCLHSKALPNNNNTAMKYFDWLNFSKFINSKVKNEIIRFQVLTNEVITIIIIAFFFQSAFLPFVQTIQQFYLPLLSLPDSH